MSQCHRYWLKKVLFKIYWFLENQTVMWLIQSSQSLMWCTCWRLCLQHSAWSCKVSYRCLIGACIYCKQWRLIAKFSCTIICWFSIQFRSLRTLNWSTCFVLNGLDIAFRINPATFAISYHLIVKTLDFMWWQNTQDSINVNHLFQSMTIFIVTIECLVWEI